MRQLSVERVLNHVRYVPLLLLAGVLLLAPGAWGQNVNHVYVVKNGIKLKCGETYKFCPNSEKLPGEYDVLGIVSTNPLAATGAKTTTAAGRVQNDTAPHIDITGTRGTGGATLITYYVQNKATKEVTAVVVPVVVEPKK